MPLYGELFVYPKSVFSSGEQRVAQTRAAEARRERELSRRWAARRRDAGLLKQKNEPLVVLVDRSTQTEERILLQVADKATQTEAELVWDDVDNLRPVATEDGPHQPLQQPQVTNSRPGLLLPRPSGPHPLWQRDSFTNYLRRSFDLIRFHDYATKRRLAARAGQDAQRHQQLLLTEYERLRQQEAQRGSLDLRTRTTQMVRGALHAVPLVCSALFPAGRAAQEWAADCAALLPRSDMAE